MCHSFSLYDVMLKNKHCNHPEYLFTYAVRYVKKEDYPTTQLVYKVYILESFIYPKIMKRKKKT